MSKEPVSRHDIAGIWVAFFSRCQRYRCQQALANEWAAQRTEMLLATMPKENLAAFRAR